MKTILSPIFIFFVGFAFGQKVELFVPSSCKPIYSRDNNWLVTYSKKTLQVWKTQNAELVWQFNYRQKKVDDSKIYHYEEAIPVFSNNSKFIAIADRDKNLFVWDITNGDSVLKIKMPERITRITFFKGDSAIAAIGETDESSSFKNIFTYIINIKNGNVKRVLGKGLYFNNDCTKLALEFHSNSSADYYSYFNIWDITLNRIIYKFKTYNEWGFSKDGNYLFYNAYPKGKENISEFATIKIFDFSKNKIVKTLKGEIFLPYQDFKEPNKSLSFPHLIYEKGGRTVVYSFNNKKNIYSFNMPIRGFDLEQNLLFVGASEKHLSLYNSYTGKYINTLNDWNVKFINKKIVLSNNDNYSCPINCYTLPSLKRSYSLKKESLICVSNSSKQMVTEFDDINNIKGRFTYYLRNASTGKKIILLPNVIGEIYKAQFSKDDEIIFFSSYSKFIIYYVNTSQYFTFNKYEVFEQTKEIYEKDLYIEGAFKTYMDIVETSDSLIYINGKTNTIVWNKYVKNIVKKLSWDGNNDIPTYFLNSNEKKLLLVTASYRTFKQLNLLTGKIDYYLKNECSAAHDSYCGISLSNDGKYFSSSYDVACNHCTGGFQTYLLKDGKRIKLDKKEDSLIRNTSYSKQRNKKIKAIVENNQLKFYQLSTGKPLYTYIPLDENNFIVYDEDGHYDASENALQYVYYSCGNKVVPASKTNYKSRVVGLVQKIMSNQKNLISQPTKEDLNICNLVE